MVATLTCLFGGEEWDGAGLEHVLLGQTSPSASQQLKIFGLHDGFLAH